MFRRIELITDRPDRKGGLMTAYDGRRIGLEGILDIFEAWAMDMPGPKGDGLGKNCRYYFTEKGWDVLGRKTIAACKKHGQKFRIITIKEKSVDTVYRDKYQVAVRPRKKKS